MPKVKKIKPLALGALEIELRRLTILCKIKGSEKDKADLSSLLEGFLHIENPHHVQLLAAAMRRLKRSLEPAPSSET
jgi:hypothetical protein